jgi:hypothetical protein
VIAGIVALLCIVLLLVRVARLYIQKWHNVTGSELRVEPYETYLCPALALSLIRQVFSRSGHLYLKACRPPDTQCNSISNETMHSNATMKQYSNETIQPYPFLY